MTADIVTAQLKAAKQAEKHARKVSRIGTDDFQKVRKCFWTWPLGHLYRRNGRTWTETCVGCGKTQYWSLW